MKMAIFVPFLTHCNSIRIMSWFLDRKQARKCIFTSILKVLDEGREFWGDAAGWHIGSNLKSPPPPCCGSNFPINRDFCGFFFYIKTTTRSVLLNVVVGVNATYMLGMNHWSNLLEKISGKLSVNDRLDSDVCCCGNFCFGSYQLDKTWEKSIVLRKLFWFFYTPSCQAAELLLNWEEKIPSPGSKIP